MCKGCGEYHLVHEGKGGEYVLPPWVSESWLKKHGCTGENFGDIPIPFVRMPADYELPMFVLPTYRAIDDQPERYELQWFS